MKVLEEKYGFYGDISETFGDNGIKLLVIKNGPRNTQIFTFFKQIYMSTLTTKCLLHFLIVNRNIVNRKSFFAHLQGF